MTPRRARTVLDLIHILLAEVQADPKLGKVTAVALDGGKALPLQIQTVVVGGKEFLTFVGAK